MLNIKEFQIVNKLKLMSFEKEKLENLQSQVEYYLSDDNLKNDKFFHDMISSSAEV